MPNIPSALREKVLASTHSKALDRYKQDPSGALLLLGYGFAQWIRTDPGFDLGADIGRPPFFKQLELDDDAKTVPMLNDYAFILAESARNASDRSARLKAAARLLEMTIAMAPERGVAFLNLADVYWDLEQHDRAREPYRKYVTLVQRTGKQPTQRALARTK